MMHSQNRTAEKHSPRGGLQVQILQVQNNQPQEPDEVPEPQPDNVPTREPDEVPPMDPRPPSELPQPDRPNEIPPGQPDELPQPDQPNELP